MATKSASIHIRMTPTEYDALQAMAAQAQLNISEVIRQLIQGEARRQEVWPTDSKAQRSERE